MGLRTLVAALVAVSGLALSAQALSIEHVEPRKMEAADYVRIGEFFGKEHSNPTRLELFSSQRSENSVAWVIETDTDIEDIPEGTQVKLELIVKGDKKAKTFDFEIPQTKVDSKVIYLAISSQDAGADEVGAPFPRILAWKVSLLNTEGELLAEAPSALWEY